MIPTLFGSGSDGLGVTQTKQDLACCEEKFPRLTCRPVSAQFMGDEVQVIEERHYLLVPAAEIGDDDLRQYANR